MNLEPVLRAFVEKTAETGISFNPRFCLRSRLHTNTCTRCLTVCDHKAIRLEDQTIAFDPEQCTGCMACVAECRANALQYAQASVDLLDLILSTANPVLTCRFHEEQGNIVFPCIGFFSKELLVALSICSKSPLQISVAWCTTCINRDCYSRFLAIFEQAQQVIDKDGDSNVQIKTQLINHGSKQQRRRALFRHTGQAMKKMLLRKEISSGESFDHKQLTKYRKSRTDKQAVIIAALKKVGDDNIIAKTRLTSCFYKILIDNNRCTKCPLCSAGCPTGALQRKRIKGKWVILVRNDRCSGCGLCLDFCKEKTIVCLPI